MVRNSFSVVFVSGWEPETSIGNRQIASVNGHLRSWTENPALAQRLMLSPGPTWLLASASVFGDGTAEL
jgi:hypothetical protein